jgi:hypothetical protein
MTTRRLAADFELFAFASGDACASTDAVEANITATANTVLAFMASSSNERVRGFGRYGSEYSPSTL